MQWAHLPPRKKMTRTFLPLWAASDPGLAGGVGAGERLGGEGGPGERAEGRQVDPVDGRLVGAGRRWPARAAGPVQVLSAFQRATIALEAAEDRQVAIGPSGDRHELAIGLAGLLLLADGLEDLDLGRQRRDLVGVLLDGLLRHALGEPVVAGRQVGPGQGLGPHRGRLGELVERRADLAAGQELVALQLRQRGLRRRRWSASSAPRPARPACFASFLAA